DSPFILNKDTDIRIRLNLVRRAKRLLVVEVVATQEIVERAERVNALHSAGEENVDAVVEKTATRFQRMRSADSRDVVDGFEQVDIAGQRRERRRTEIRHARDPDYWSDVVVHRRVQTAIRVLDTQLIQRTIIDRGHVTGLDCLIRVAKTCAATHRV